MKNVLILLITFILICCAENIKSQCNFSNPIQAAESPDPWVIYKDGFYYYMVTTGDGVWIHKSNKLQQAGNAPSTKVWSSPNSGIQSDVWAPELHYLNNRWYIYSCGTTVNGMRMFVLEGDSTDALKPYKYIGLLNPNVWAIDASVWLDPKDNAMYIVWSQRDPDQSIFIAKMKSPTELMEPYVKLSKPSADWERKGWNVNEGPTCIKHNNNIR